MATRPVCKYGASCYRKNPDHFKQFSHPGREKAQQGDGGGGRDTAPSAAVGGGSIDKGTAQSQSKAQRNSKVRPQVRVPPVSPRKVFLRFFWFPFPRKGFK